MSELVDKLPVWTAECLESDDIFIIETNVLGNARSSRKIVIVLDKDNGISIDECTLVSRKLSQILDEYLAEDDSYILEVTSPGTDRPLKFKRQYKRTIGKTLNVVLTNDIEYEGIVSNVTDELITLNYTTKEKGKKAVEQQLDILFDQIKKAIVVITF
jgi:ribosome maturation factor RimP